MGEMIAGKNKKSGFGEQAIKCNWNDLSNDGRKETIHPIHRSESTRCQEETVENPQ